MKILFFFPPMALRPNAGYSLLIHDVSISHTTTQGLLWTVISSSKRPLPENTQNSKQTSMSPGGIRTLYLSRRATADQSFRPRGLWDQQGLTVPVNIITGIKI
jgi:hypothetical protein